MKKLLIFLSISVFVFAATFAAFGQRAARIRFSRAESSAAVSGTLRGYNDKKIYVIRVRSGQTLQTRQIDRSNYITIYIKNPAGEDVGDSDASCNNRREISPTEAGDYRIRVVECRKADRWRGLFRFLIIVR